MAAPKILISRCFLGDKVKYNGGDNQLTVAIIDQWQAENRLVAICPEVAGGLSIPRAPAEINGLKKVLTGHGEDVSQAFERGATLALALCKKHHIRFALLKESSPSCGSDMIYDGSFSGKKIVGEGITSALLRKHGIAVYSEKTIELLISAVSRTG